MRVSDAEPSATPQEVTGGVPRPRVSKRVEVAAVVATSAALSSRSYLDGSFESLDLSVDHPHATTAALSVGAAASASAALAAIATHDAWERVASCGAAQMTRKKRVEITRARSTSSLRYVLLSLFLGQLSKATKRGLARHTPSRRVSFAMGGPPDASRVGGVWFPDVTPEEWALPDGLASHVITPALVIDLKKVRRNVATVKRALGGDLNRWRPHLKTTKMSIVWLELVRAGVKNFKVATTKEAAVLAVTLETYLDRCYRNRKVRTLEKCARTRDSADAKDGFEDAFAPPRKNSKGTLESSSTRANARATDHDPEDSSRAEVRRRLMKEKAAFDVLVAYPLVGPARERLSRLAKAFPWITWSVLIEAEEVVDAAGPEAAAPAHRASARTRHARYEDDNVGYFVDVNPGMHRTGAEMRTSREPFSGARRDEDDVAAALDLRIYRACVNDARVQTSQEGSTMDISPRPFLGFRGIHFYEGHFAECVARSGNSAAETETARLARAGACAALYENALAPVLSFLRKKGVPPVEVITSGTPGFTHALEFDIRKALVRLMGPGEIPETVGSWVAQHRVSPGTVVFHDWRGERQNPGLGLVPAAVLMSRVVSLPAEGRCTLDCGSKSIAAEAGDPAGYILGRPTWRATGCSEEHLPIVFGEHRGGEHRGGDSLVRSEEREVRFFSLSEEVEASRHERPSGGSVIAGAVSDTNAGRGFVDGDLLSKRRRPWDVALARRQDAGISAAGTGTAPVSLGSYGDAGVEPPRDTHATVNTDERVLIPGDAVPEKNALRGDIPRRGDLVFVVPEHICPTVNLAEQAVVLDGGELVGVMEVEARGHEIVPTDLPPAPTTRALREAAEGSVRRE